MKIKTYRVSTLTEAVDRIKRDLGPEAVVLSTRRTSSDKWWQPGKALLEVTAAIENREARLQQGAVEPGLDQTLKLIAQVTDERLNPLRDEVSRLRQMLESSSFSPAQKTVEPPRFEDPPSSPPAQDTVAQVKDKGETVIYLSQHLLGHYIHPALVSELADELMARKSPLSAMEIQEVAARWLYERLPEARPFRFEQGHPKVLALLGPTGSGKTTTLAKLASHFALDLKKSIALISLDHFRVGAAEQLHRYAEILGVPHALAHTREELVVAVGNFQNVDLILLDTSGRSPYDAAGIRDLAKCLDLPFPVWKALVLPATQRDVDLEILLNHFSALQPERLIVTKLDETLSFGGLYNASYRSGLPLAYLTMGQQVPEDIEEASRERVLDCLFNFAGSFPGTTSVFDATLEAGAKL